MSDFRFVQTKRKFVWPAGGVPYGSQKNVRSRPSLIIFDKGAAARTIFPKIGAEGFGANCRNIYSIDVSAFVSEIHVHNFAGCAGDELSAKSPKQSMKHGSLMLHATARQFPGCSCFLESLGFEGDSWINLESSLFWALAMGNVDNFWLCERSSGEALGGEAEGGESFFYPSHNSCSLIQVVCQLWSHLARFVGECFGAIVQSCLLVPLCFLCTRVYVCARVCARSFVCVCACVYACACVCVWAWVWGVGVGVGAGVGVGLGLGVCLGVVVEWVLAWMYVCVLVCACGCACVCSCVCACVHV